MLISSAQHARYFSGNSQLKCREKYGARIDSQPWNRKPTAKSQRPTAGFKSGTGDPLHTQEPVTVASFRTWRGWREGVARDRCLTDQF